MARDFEALELCLLVTVACTPHNTAAKLCLSKGKQTPKGIATETVGSSGEAGVCTRNLKAARSHVTVSD